MSQKKLALRLMLCIAFGAGAMHLLEYTHGWGPLGILIGSMIFIVGVWFMVRTMVLQAEAEYDKRKNF